MLYGILKTTVLGPALRVMFRPGDEGVQNFPEDGPVLLVANHQSFSDSIFMPLVTPRPVKFLAKAEYFDQPGFKGRLSAGFFRGVGSIPIDRSGAKAAEAALNTALRLLEEGEVVGMYPEGTRSPDGRLYKGRTGVARIALAARCPVVPVAIFGTSQVQPTGKMIPRLHKVDVRFGKPLDFTRFTGPDGALWSALDGTDAQHVVLRTVTDEIMYTLMSMTGQEYTDSYAPSKGSSKRAAAAIAAAE